MKFFLIFCLSLYAARIKDVAHLKGLESHDLVGYGLVVGLKGTGDGPQTGFTTKSVINMLKNMGIEVPNSKIRTRNVAAVMVITRLKPFEKKGSRIDVSLSSMGDARSLEGGTLLMTPLQNERGDVFVLAQGALSTGGYAQFSNSGKKSRSKNQVLSAAIPNGGKIIKEPKGKNIFSSELQWVLNQPDFTSAIELAKNLNETFGEELAEVLDASTIRVKKPNAINQMLFISQMEQVEFSPNMRAKVILNEKTGTIIAGANVRVSSVAISHGSLTLQLSSENSVSQPNALSNGQTAKVAQEKSDGEESMPEVKVMPEITNVGELASNLNTLGLSPRDIITIFQAIKKAGALHAELEIM